MINHSIDHHQILYKLDDTKHFQLDIIRAITTCNTFLIDLFLHIKYLGSKIQNTFYILFETTRHARGFYSFF